MIGVPIYILYVNCNTAYYTCSFTSFPDLKTAIGIFPFDKLMVFVFTFYACVMFTFYRAIYNKLRIISIPDFMNIPIFICGFLATISGPLSATFNDAVNMTYQDKDQRIVLYNFFILLFLFSRIGFIFTLVEVFNRNPDQF
jgi:hypothetical protein